MLVRDVAEGFRCFELNRIIDWSHTQSSTKSTVKIYQDKDSCLASMGDCAGDSLRFQAGPDDVDMKFVWYTGKFKIFTMWPVSRHYIRSGLILLKRSQYYVR